MFARILLPPHRHILSVGVLRYFVIETFEMTTTLLIGLLIPLLGTMLGAAFVFFMKREMPERLQKALLGFASGVIMG